ncbi:MAG: hypothetical protein ACE5JL_02975 [Dehalococcoidia bacterium]
MVGGPDECIEALHGYQEVVGMDLVLFCPRGPWILQSAPPVLRRAVDKKVLSALVEIFVLRYASSVLHFRIDVRVTGVA